ncbi:ankyrin repeat domain-containing protein [Dyadobacter sp. CY261]|uniref:ankyrin repeat domain-containing protein n=1 Tax=Dyadobacter sp. CY261 TaxID=2907203 RepID=UPI001F35A929|nr:ankyrin repeat domain-containing protein [Dyadobacter sp. CY261]MCF0074133.1 ankyrin repeat domain-containing protein [Dyadobacter sp. CY261]
MPENTPQPEDLQASFIRAAIWHGSLDEANAMLELHPGLADMSIFTAAILGNVGLVEHFLAADPANGTNTAAPYGGNALVYLCMSKYLRLEKERGEDFLKAARLFLDAGVDPNSGFWTTGNFPEFETALYGAAGIAHHEAMTRLLLAFGADPNDEEAVYHSPETDENGAMRALVETGRVTPINLALMLIRKHDFHDYYGAKWLLEQGADPNAVWHNTSPFHHALARVNHIAFIKLLLDHGANPEISVEGLTAAAKAARQGRADVLSELQKRNIPYTLKGLDKLIQACAFGDAPEAQSIANGAPYLLKNLLAMGGELLAGFASCGNAEGVRMLLDLGVKVDEPFAAGDGYWDIPKGSLAIHIAAWLAYPDVIQLLILRGSPIDTPDANGRTPMDLAVRACIDSYWMDRRTPKSVEILLKAGAKADGISLPTGYAPVDELLGLSGDR